MPATRAQVYRRRRLAVFGGAATLLVAGGYLPMTLFAPLEPTAATVVEVGAPVVPATELAWPSSTAVGIGAVGFDGVLAATGSTEALPMASITKVITALVVLERHPLTLDHPGPMIEYTKTDVSYFGQYQSRGATVEPVYAGMQLSQYDAMAAMLLPSAANYSLSLVTWAFGDVDAFVAEAERWLTANELHNTVVAEPTGLAPANQSTVNDLIELGKIVLADPVMSKLVATPAIDIPGVGVLENSNKILGFRGVDGIKTGTLPEAGACLLFSTDFQVGGSTVTVVGVALGGTRHAIQYPQIQSLLETVESGFHEVPLAEKGEVFGSYLTEWGDRADVVAAETRSALVWGDTPVALSVHTEPVAAAHSGSRVGTATFTVGTENVEVRLELSKAISDPGPLWRLTNPQALFD